MEKGADNQPPEIIPSDNDPTSGGEARKSTGSQKNNCRLWMYFVCLVISLCFLGSKDSSSAAVIGELNKIIRLKKRLKSAVSKRP